MFKTKVFKSLLQGFSKFVNLFKKNSKTANCGSSGNGLSKEYVVFGKDGKTPLATVERSISSCYNCDAQGRSVYIGTSHQRIYKPKPGTKLAQMGVIDVITTKTPGGTSLLTARVNASAGCDKLARMGMPEVIPINASASEIFSRANVSGGCNKTLKLNRSEFRNYIQSMKV